MACLGPRGLNFYLHLSPTCAIVVFCDDDNGVDRNMLKHDGLLLVFARSQDLADRF